MIKLLVLFLNIALAKEPIRIAIVDTGVTPNLNVPLCEGLSKDFTGYNTLNDNIGHGTIVSTLVNVYAKGTNYCQVILRVFDANDIKADPTGKPYIAHSFENVTNAMKYLNTISGISVVNLSLGSASATDEEAFLFKNLLNNNVMIINAAGNESMNLDTACNWFPGCYDPRIVMVGNLGPDNKPHYSSNYGKRVNVWVIGTNLKINGNLYTGTSFSAALISGAMVKILNEKK